MSSRAPLTLGLPRGVRRPQRRPPRHVRGGDRSIFLPPSHDPLFAIAEAARLKTIEDTARELNTFALPNEFEKMDRLFQFYKFLVAANINMDDWTTYAKARWVASDRARVTTIKNNVRSTVMTLSRRGMETLTRLDIGYILGLSVSTGPHVVIDQSLPFRSAIAWGGVVWTPNLCVLFVNEYKCARFARTIMPYKNALWKFNRRCWKMAWYTPTQWKASGVNSALARFHTAVGLKQVYVFGHKGREEEGGKKRWTFIGKVTDSQPRAADGSIALTIT